MRRALLLLPLLASTASAGIIDGMKGKAIDDYTIQLEGRYWLATLNAEMMADTSFLDGTDIDLDSDLGLDETEQLWEVDATLRVKTLLVHLAYTQAVFENDKTLSETISFEGHTFTVSDNVHSSVRLILGGLDLEYLLLDVGSGTSFGFELGVGTGVRYLRFQGRIASEGTGWAEVADRDAWIPVISVYASVAVVNILRVDLQVGGLKLPRIGGFRGMLIDGSIEAKVFLHHLVYVGIGYRLLYLEADYEKGGNSVELNGRVGGFFGAVGVVF